MNLEDTRAWFPHTRHTVYLNHAATSPLSIHVRGAVDQFLQERQEDHIDNYWAFAPIVQQTRERVARLFKTTAEHVDLVPNTSYGLNILARGLSWKKGDQILIPDCEFPANVYPFLALEKQGVEIVYVPAADGTFSVEDVTAKITDRTRLITVSWVQFLSGYLAPIAELGALCRSHNILFCVDAIQGLGGVVWPESPESLGVDFISGGAHKWMMGTQGLGYFFAGPKVMQMIEPPMAGWLSGPVDWDRFFDYKLEYHPDTTRFRIGTMNGIGIAAFHAALGQYLEAGPEQCETHVRSLAEHVRAHAIERGFEIYGSLSTGFSAGIVSFKTPNPEQLVVELAKKRIEVAVRNRLIRFSPIWYNTHREIETAFIAIDEILGSSGRLDLETVEKQDLKHV